MRDTSELPDATEQAKQTGTNTRTKSQARSKVESPATVSQEQENRPAPRRRNTSTTHGSTTRNQQGNAPAPADSAPTDTSRPAPQGGPPPRAQGHPSTAPQRQGNPSGPSQRQGYSSGPSQRQGNPSGPSQRQGGYRNNNGGNGSSYAPQGQRTASNSAAAPAAGGTRPSSPYRSGQPQRQGYPSTQQRTNPSTGSQQQGSQRQPNRPGGGPSGSRPGGHHGPPNRNAQRTGSNTQRSQDRRTVVAKEKPTGPIAIPPQMMVKDLADLLHTTPIEIMRDLINKHSIFVSINQVVDYEKAALVAQDLGYEPHPITATDAPAVRSDRPMTAEEILKAARHDDNTVIVPPVITIMGHVDHGKTSLLDTIRKTKVADSEAGGITQHIGAYQVEVNGKKITFLDTPGHEAFTAMRARGAQVAHIAIIVVAADDGVMPQTREAIDHAKAANMPIIIALNKIDKANANPDRVKQQLADIGILIEEYGGDIVCVPLSARKGTGIDDLLEYILLVAEVQDIRANPNRNATGVIIEARLEKSSGASATVLVQQGTLKMGDNIVVGAISGKVRAMFNDRGKRIQKAPPSTPVSILGLPEVPQAGDRLEVVNDERTARQRAQDEAEKRRDETMPLGQVSLDTLYMQEGKTKELNIVLKCDVQGSAEAIKGALSKLGEENLKVRLIHEGIGNISETDVHLSAASKALIIGFNVKADGAAQREAQKEGVEIRYYNVIYKLTDDIQAALAGMLEPTYREVVDGHAEVLQTFPTKKIVIAGCRITDGKIMRSSHARVMRKGEKVFDGLIASLRRGKDDVREVASGYECGILLEDFNDFEIGDIIEAFSQERVLPGA